MNEWIRTADGTEIRDTYIVRMDMDSIAIYARGITRVRDAWEIFGDPEKTREIHSWQYGDEADWTGYTEPTAIQANRDGAVICLRKGTTT